MKPLSISKLKYLISKGGIILDTRLNDEYIGWDISNSGISGHIPGSVSFPYNWTDFASKSQLNQYLNERGINSRSIVILCDFNENDYQPVLSYLKSENFNRMFYFNLKLWKDKLEFYNEYKRLIPCIWLNSLINNKKVLHSPKKDYKIFEVSWGQASKEYMKEHIPESIHIDSEEFEKPPEWIRIPDPELIKLLNKYGITQDTTVIIYGMDSLNQLGAAKFSVILEYIGVRDVRLLNGTFQNWKYFGFETENGNRNLIGDETNFGEPDKKSKNKIFDIEDIKCIFKNNLATQVVDIRNYEAWSGKDTGYCYVSKAGRIPGTVWCHHKSCYRNFDNTICSKEEILEFWANHHLDISKDIVAFCGSASWGAALIQIYARVIGMERVFIYEGGWVQWQLDAANEIIQGN